MICKGYLVAAPVDFGIARSHIRYSHHVFISLHSEEVDGWGEGVLYRATPHQVAHLFAGRVRAWVEALELSALPNANTQSRLLELAAYSPALAYAVDTALLDLRSRAEGSPLGDWLGGLCRKALPLTEQLFLRDWTAIRVELEGMLGRGTRRFKVKIGYSPSTDLCVVRCIRDAVGHATEIRVDANRAYALAEGRDLYRRLADLGVLGLEEPLRCRDWSDLRDLRRDVGLPIILDESIQRPEALRQAIDAQAVDVLNLKLTRVGGFSLARPYLELCDQHGVQVAVGCSEELGVGTAAIAHMAAALPELHSMEGLGPLRLGFDIIPEPWVVHDGALQLPAGSGLGVAPTSAWGDQLPGRVRCFDLTSGSWQLWPFSTYSRLLQRASNVLWRARRRVVH
jgi:L-alanine-DL-glutamate epimerase-like enolase superfamily enzyme